MKQKVCFLKKQKVFKCLLECQINKENINQFGDLCIIKMELENVSDLKYKFKLKVKWISTHKLEECFKKLKKLNKSQEDKLFIMLDSLEKTDYKMKALNLSSKESYKTRNFD